MTISRTHSSVVWGSRLASKLKERYCAYCGTSISGTPGRRTYCYSKTCENVHKEKQKEKAREAVRHYRFKNGISDEVKPSSINECIFCGADIRHLHHSRISCTAPECVEKMEERQKALRCLWHLDPKERKKAKQKKPKKKSKEKVHRCLNCGEIITSGWRLYCDKYCRREYLGEGRCDGDFLYMT